MEETLQQNQNQTWVIEAEWTNPDSEWLFGCAGYITVINTFGAVWTYHLHTAGYGHSRPDVAKAAADVVIYGFRREMC